MDAAISALANSLAALVPVWKSAADTTLQQAQQAQTPKLKPKDPPVFSGDPALLTPFIAEMVFYFRIMNIIDDRTKIDFALSFVRGGENNSATAWADAQRRNILVYEAFVPKDSAKPEPNPNLHPFTTWQAFQDSILSHFAIRNQSEEAILNLRLLEQENKTCDEYLVMFKTYAGLSGYNDVALLEEFKRGLNKSLLQQLMMSYPLPTTLAEYYD